MKKCILVPVRASDDFSGQVIDTLRTQRPNLQVEVRNLSDFTNGGIRFPTFFLLLDSADLAAFNGRMGISAYACYAVTTDPLLPEGRFKRVLTLTEEDPELAATAIMKQLAWLRWQPARAALHDPLLAHFAFPALFLLLLSLALKPFFRLGDAEWLGITIIT